MHHLYQICLAVLFTLSAMAQTKTTTQPKQTTNSTPAKNTTHKPPPTLSQQTDSLKMAAENVLRITGGGIVRGIEPPSL